MRNLLILTLFLSLYGWSVRSSEPQSLHEYLENEITALNDEMVKNDDTKTERGSPVLWYFRRLWFRVRPNVPLTSGIAKVGIVPEIEIGWDRPLPEGYVPHEP